MEELKESLLTIRNLCDIASLIIESGKVTLVPTILELIYAEAQEILDVHCIKKE